MQCRYCGSSGTDVVARYNELGVKSYLCYNCGEYQRMFVKDIKSTAKKQQRYFVLDTITNKRYTFTNPVDAVMKKRQLEAKYAITIITER